MLRTCCALVAVVVLAGCRGGGSQDAGVESDSGTSIDGGADSGTPQVVDSGVNDSACQLDQQNCPAGTGSCLVIAPDGGLGDRTACVLGDCDLVQQNCPTGQKCTYVPGDAGAYVRGCTPEGTAEEGALCTPTATSNTCKRGLICSTRSEGDGGTASRCAKFCNAKSDCGADQLCYVTLAFEGSIERPLTCGAAPPSCSLFTQDCPNASDGCYPDGDTGRCFPAGNIPSGGTCQYSNDCTKRSICVELLSGKECRELCSYPSGPAACTGGTCKQVSLPDAGYCG